MNFKMFNYPSEISSKKTIQCKPEAHFETHALDLKEWHEILQVVALSLEFINIACVI